jgi:hypothetical protein
MQCATFNNRGRCSINTGLFSELIKTKPDKAVVTFADDVETHGADKKKCTLKDKETFWTECSKDDVKCPGSTSLRINPMLKLHPGCRNVVSENIHVRDGAANSAQARFQSLVLMHGNAVSRTAVDGIEMDCLCFCFTSVTPVVKTSQLRESNCIQIGAEETHFDCKLSKTRSIEI